MLPSTFQHQVPLNKELKQQQDLLLVDQKSNGGTLTKLVLGTVDNIPTASIGMLSLALVWHDVAMQVEPLVLFAAIEAWWQVARSAQHKYLVPRLTRPAPALREDFWKRMLDATADPKGFVEGWFQNIDDVDFAVSLSHVRRSDVEEWIGLNTFGEDYPKAYKQKVREMRMELEKKLNYEFPVHGERLVKPLAPFSEPVKAKQHPLLLYLYLGVMRTVHARQLTEELGFESRAKNTAFGYYLRRGKGSGVPPDLASARGNGTPIVFVHGIGAGLPPYSGFISELVAKAGERPIILLEIPAISMQPNAEPLPGGDVVANELHRLLITEFNSPACVLVAHSFGSTLCSFLSRYQPETLKGIVLIEPVCFLLNLAKTTRQVLYCNNDDDPILNLVVQDPGNSISLRRRFWWHEAQCLADDLIHLNLVASSTIFLAQDDNTVPSADVASYLMATPFHVRQFNSASHGQWQYNLDHISRVVEATLRTAREVDYSNVYSMNPIMIKQKDLTRTERNVKRTLVHLRRQAVSLQNEVHSKALYLSFLIPSFKQEENAKLN